MNQVTSDDRPSTEPPLSRSDRALLRAALEVCEKAAVGDLEARLVGIDGDSDVARLAHAINHMLDLTDAFVREACASLENVAQDRFHRRVLPRGMHGSFARGAVVINGATEAMGKRSAELREIRGQQRQMATEFEAHVKGVAQSVAAAATQLQSSARSLSDTAAHVVEQATASALASDEASAGAQVVSGAAEQLKGSIAQISRQVRQSTEVASAAVERVKVTDDTVNGLAETARSIGDVVRVVHGIAGQTKLLALNAAIEAARAGAAGKGFAVVASEVKNLAGQAAAATDDVAQRIEGIQQVTQRAVEATREVGSTIGAMDGITASIAEAMEHQRDATEEITRAIERASDGARRVSGNVAQITDAARQSGRATEELLYAASELSQLGERLLGEVDRFLALIRA